MGRDHVLERDERVLGDLDEARQDLLGHLDTSEHVVVEVGVVQADDQAERQVGDVGEGAAGADGQRRQHGEDVLAEVALDDPRVGIGLLAGDDPDAVLGELGADHILELARVAVVEVAHALGDLVEQLARRDSVRPAGVDAGFDLVVHTGHADHEVLVEIGDEDGQELDPLEQRQRLVLGELEHPVVEVQPGELAVDVERRFGELDARGVGMPVGVERRGHAEAGRGRGGLDLVAHATFSASSVIAASSAGRISTTSSPFEMPASPPFFIRA